MLGSGTEVGKPALRGSAPHLLSWDQLIALPDGADADGQRRCSADSARVDRRSAIRAERLFAMIAALGGLHVDLRPARQEPEAVAFARDVDPECRAGERLAVGAMTDQDLGRIDLRLVGDCA